MPIDRSDPIALLESALDDVSDAMSILKRLARGRQERCPLAEKLDKVDTLLEDVVSALELERDERSKVDG